MASNSKQITLRQGLISVLFWSIISAAFIGPGTVTTAAMAGAKFDLNLLWALVFATAATILLQEAAARITLASGKSLGEIIALKYKSEVGDSIKMLLFLSLSFGCAAYQAGNILGAVSGLSFVTSFSPKWLAFFIALGCTLVLLIGNITFIAKLLGIVVGLMGIFFLLIAFQSQIPFYGILQASLLPSFPDGSMLYIIGLVGTTIVPYNLFLSSGIGKGQKVSEMRWGVAISVLLGGIISMAILIVGSQVEEEFSFGALARVLSKQNNPGISILFGFGLMAAGMSSAITAPLAAAVTASSLFHRQPHDWSPRSLRFRLVWSVVLLIGLSFALLDIKPIPAIILAQAINGVLLPVFTVFVFLMVNDIRLLPDGMTNSLILNLLTLLVVGISCFLGVYNIITALSKVVALDIAVLEIVFVAAIVSLLLVIVLFWKVYVSKR